MTELPPPPEGIVLAHFIVSDDVERSRRFYTEVLGGTLAFSGPGGLTYVALAVVPTDVVDKGRARSPRFGLLDGLTTEEGSGVPC